MLRIHRTRLSQNKLSRMSWLGLAGTVSCCALVLVFGLMLFPFLPQATYAAPEPGAGGVTPSTGTSAGINLPASIDFDSVTPTPDGATTTATADLTVTTTNSASYSLYLYSSDGDNSLRPKISANTSSIIATAGGVGLTLSSLKPNTWGYNLGTEAPTDSTTYSAVPADNSAPIQTKNTSSTNSANDTYTLSFGAKVDTSIPSGAYSDTLTIAVVAEPAFLTVVFDGNGATSGSMSSIQMLPGEQRTLPSNAFSRGGYDFTTWNTSPDGNGIFYTDGASYTAPTASAGKTIVLYAQWGFSKNTMQGFTHSDCQLQASSDNVTLVDVRDNNTYTVRYINGACWMTQNLRLGGGTKLNSSASNVTSDYTLPADSITYFDGTALGYYNGGVHYSGNVTTGSWYNYCAASAGTACGSPVTWNITSSVCPKGWTIPTRDDMESVVNFISAFQPAGGGYHTAQEQPYNPNYGYWYSATMVNSQQRYYMYYNGSSLTVRQDAGRAIGYFVRCVRSD